MPEAKSVAYKSLLIRVLRKNGYKKLCKGEQSDFTAGSLTVSIVFLLSVLFSLWLFGITRLDLSAWTALMSIVGTLLFGVILVALQVLSTLSIYMLFVVAWIIAGTSQLIRHDLPELAVTHLLPFAAVVGARWIWQAMRFTTRIPLFIPASFIVVIAPLLTEDPWRLAAEARWQLMWLGLLIIVPLAIFAAIKLSRVPIDEAFAVGHEALDSDGVVDSAMKKIRRVKAANEKFDEDAVRARLMESYSSPDRQAIVSEIVATVHAQLIRRAIRRLFSAIIGMALFSFGLVYLLAMAGIPFALAGEWSKISSSSTTVEVFKLTLTVGAAPYLWVSALFSAIATAGFLAFSLTDDSYAKSLRFSVVSLPAADCLKVAVPYFHLKSEETSSSSGG